MLYTVKKPLTDSFVVAVEWSYGYKSQENYGNIFLDILSMLSKFSHIECVKPAPSNSGNANYAIEEYVWIFCL